MDETEIITDYYARYKYAKYCQYLAGLLLLISVSFLWISGGGVKTTGGTVFLVVGGILLIASISLAVLSINKNRCPNCFRSLGVVRKIKFCPYCGVQLQTVEEPEEMYASHDPGERRVGFAWMDGIRFPGGGISRTKISQAPEQGGIRPGASDFPAETYPKNIRLFTTSDEMELTKRYIRLITRDDSGQPEGIPAVLPGNAAGLDPKRKGTSPAVDKR